MLSRLDCLRLAGGVEACGVDARRADQASHRHAGEPRRERKAERDTSSALVNPQPSRNWEARQLADPAVHAQLADAISEAIADQLAE